MVWRRKLARLRAELHGWRDLILAGRIALLAALLPGLIRSLGLPALMRILTPAHSRRRTGATDLDRIVRLTDLVLGRVPLTRQTCLVRSLVLYRLLRTDGVAVRIHFGVQKADGRLAGHSWLTHQGQLLAETSTGKDFSEIYAYPADSGMLASEEIEERSLCAWPG
jgi:hypothetical protein